MEEAAAGQIPARPRTARAGRRRGSRAGRLAGFAPWLLIAALAAATIVATIWSLRERGLGQDAAAWAQAAGSVIAICAAIWISDRENGRRRRERRDEQEASVWAVLYALQLAEKETALIYWQLKESPVVVDEESWKSWRTMLHNSCAMLRYAAGRIDHFHPGFAQEAHNAIILGEELLALFDVGRRRSGKQASRDALLSDLGNHAYNFSILGQRLSHRMLYVRRRIARGSRIDHDWDSYSGPKYFDDETA